MLSKLDLVSALEKELIKRFGSCQLTNDSIIIKTEQMDINIPISKAYEDYKGSGDHTKLVKSFVETITEMQDKYKFEIDYNEVFPFVKHSSFMKDNNIPFVRERLFLDLDLLYVSNLSNSFRFILKGDSFDLHILKERAFNNLNLALNKITRIDESFDIYSLNIQTDLAATFLFSKNIQKQIRKFVGKNFIFAVPSSSTLLIAKDLPDYKRILKDVIELDPDPNKISSSVYRWTSSGRIEYATNPVRSIK